MKFTMTFKSPLGTITAPFGSIDSVHTRPHTGIDYAAPTGTELYAPLSGIVTKVQDYGKIGLGKSVFVKTSDGFTYCFGHLSKALVRVGEKVHKGELIALSGNTGHSTGSHVHFGLYDKFGHHVNPNVLFEAASFKKPAVTELVFNFIEKWIDI